MECKNCGKEIDDRAVICPGCGVPQSEIATVQDSGSLGWGVLSCFVPVVGLVLFIIWKDTKPKSAKAAGIGALVAVGLTVLFYIFIIILGFLSLQAY